MDIEQLMKRTVTESEINFLLRPINAHCVYKVDEVNDIEYYDITVYGLEKEWFIPVGLATVGSVFSNIKSIEKERGRQEAMKGIRDAIGIK